MATLIVYVDVPLDPARHDPEEVASDIAEAFNDDRTHTACDGVQVEVLKAWWE